MVYWLGFCSVAAGLAFAPAVQAQTRPYIGYVYPAGGKQGTTFQVKLGGQGLDDVNGAIVSGDGVTAKVTEYLRRLNPQEMQLLSEQLRELRKATNTAGTAKPQMMMSDDSMMMMAAGEGKKKKPSTLDAATLNMMGKLEKRIKEYVQTPACASIANIVMAEVTISPNATPGPRELRLVTPRGVSNPLRFFVGQLPETTRPAMITAPIQILGKEELALRKRPTNEVEVRITLPCTMNGQIASGEINRYRFTASKGQRLVITTHARELIPYIADAVPGWFQPVLALYDASGKELAYDDDFRFKPDPVILYEVPRDGEYVLAIFDSIHRGREDFIYRINIGELPFITSLFPLGGKVGSETLPKMKGWNLQDAVLTPLPKDAKPGIHYLAATRKGLVSNPMPFILDTLPEAFDKEPNNSTTNAQKISLPIAINGLINRKDDWDVFQFQGKSNDWVVVEVMARRLDSPVDSIIKLTDASGKVIAVNDDCEDLGSGFNTHHADSYFMVKLPSNGAYYVHIGDTARQGGEEYGYRLRISYPQPDFDLRIVPSSVSFRTTNSATLNVHAIRKDGFNGPITINLKNPPAGLTSAPVTLPVGQLVARLNIKSNLKSTKEPVRLAVEGRAKIGDKEIAHEATPAEDRMQAFLWRHLAPAADLVALVYDPAFEPPPRRVPPKLPSSLAGTNTLAMTKATAATNSPTVASTPNAPAPSGMQTNAPAGTSTNTVTAAKPKFTKQQVASRLRQLKLLYEEGLLTDEFYCEKVAECEAAQ